MGSLIKTFLVMAFLQIKKKEHENIIIKGLHVSFLFAIIARYRIIALKQNSNF